VVQTHVSHIAVDITYLYKQPVVYTGPHSTKQFNYVNNTFINTHKYNYALLVFNTEHSKTWLLRLLYGIRMHYLHQERSGGMLSMIRSYVTLTGNHRQPRQQYYRTLGLAGTEFTHKFSHSFHQARGNMQWHLTAQEEITWAKYTQIIPKRFRIIAYLNQLSMSMADVCQ
jgi:hypothetical protein